MTEVLHQVDPQVVADLIMLAVADVELCREMLHRRRENDRQEIVLALVDVLRAQPPARAVADSTPDSGPCGDAGQAGTLESTP